MFKSLSIFFRKNVILTSLIVSIAYIFSISLFIFPGNFKFGVIFSFVFVFFFYRISKNFFVSIFSVFLLSSFFLSPAKTYFFEYASASQFSYEPMKEGFIETITLDISDIFNIIFIMWFLRQRLRGDPRLSEILNSRLLSVICLLWSLYLVISLYSTLHFSVYPAFSLHLLFKYTKILSLFIGTVYLFRLKGMAKNIFFSILTAILLVQTLLGFVQFALSFSASGQSQRSVIIDVEEKTGFTRIVGLSVHPNAHAFSTILLLILTRPFLVNRSKNLAAALVLLSVVNIILTQCRVIWFSSFVPVFFYLVFNKDKISFNKELLKKTIKNRIFAVISFLGVSLMFFIVQSRLSTIGFFFSDAGGSKLRRDMIFQGWQMLNQSKWAGFGLGMGVHIFLDRYKNGYATYFPFPIHFAYLQIALESGIIGSIAFFSPLVLILRKALNQIKDQYSPDLWSVVSTVLITFLYYSLQPVYGRKEYLFFSLIVGMGMNIFLKENLGGKRA